MSLASARMYVPLEHTTRMVSGIFSASKDSVGAFGVYGNGRIHRGDLPLFSYKLRDSLVYQCSCDMGSGKCLINGVLHIIGGGGSTQLHSGYILFGVVLQLLNHFRFLAGADNHHSGRQRVKRSAMTDLQFLLPQATAQHSTHLCHYIEAGPVEGLVEC